MDLTADARLVTLALALLSDGADLNEVEGALAAVGGIVDVTEVTEDTGIPLVCGHTAPVRESWGPRYEDLFADGLLPCGTCHRLTAKA